MQRHLVARYVSCIRSGHLSNRVAIGPAGATSVANSSITWIYHGQTQMKIEAKRRFQSSPQPKCFRLSCYDSEQGERRLCEHLSLET